MINVKWLSIVNSLNNACSIKKFDCCYISEYHFNIISSALGGASQFLVPSPKLYKVAQYDSYAIIFVATLICQYA